MINNYPHSSLRWRHNDHAGVSNHQPHGCLLNRLFRRKSKKTSKLRVTGHCAGNSPGTGEFPAQMASYAENVSIWWRHHVLYILKDVISDPWPKHNLDSELKNKPAAYYGRIPRAVMHLNFSTDRTEIFNSISIHWPINMRTIFLTWTLLDFTGPIFIKIVWIRLLIHPLTTALCTTIGKD